MTFPMEPILTQLPGLPVSKPSAVGRLRTGMERQETGSEYFL